MRAMKKLKAGKASSLFSRMRPIIAAMDCWSVTASIICLPSWMR